MKAIPNSADISVLDFSILYDLSLAIPGIVLTNLSSGNNLAGCAWWYEIFTPSGTAIHQGSDTAHDATGVWSPITVDTSGNKWPKPFGQIEWSGVNYLATLYVKDVAGNIFSTTIETAIIRPYGCDSDAKGNFAVASLRAEMMCDKGKFFVEDKTGYSYNGLPGINHSQEFTFIYPTDDSGTAPSPVVLSGHSTALFEVSFSAPGYQIIYNSVMRYDYPNNGSVMIKYKVRNLFAVQCDTDLCPLICEFSQLLENSRTGNVTNKEEADEIIQQVTGLLLEAVIGKMQPLCGIDVAAIVAKIKEIAGFTCECSLAGGTSGIGTNGSLGNLNVSINSTCGDIGGAATVTGSNITLDLHDVSYDFIIDSTSDLKSAFTISSSVDGSTCKKTYKLKIHADQLPGGCCPQYVQVVTKGTSSAPSQCPGNYFPKDLYKPDGVTKIGTVNDINEMISKMISDTGSGGWAEMGTWIPSGFCQVVLFKSTTFTGSVVHIPVADLNSGGCVNNQQTYIMLLKNFGSTGPYVPVAYPLNAYIQFTTGGAKTLLPNIANYGALLTALNVLGNPPKPASISFNPQNDHLGFQVVDTDCANGNNVSIEVDAYAAQPLVNTLLYASPHNNGQGVVSGVVPIDAVADTQLNFVCGTKDEKYPWHSIKVGTNLYTVESDTGKFRIIDLSDPVYPVISKTMIFPQPSGAPNAAFSGNPSYSGGRLSHYDTYFPTDLNSEVSGFIYLVESASGCIWKFDLTSNTVVASEYSIHLVGKCPRFIIGNRLYMSCDGNRESSLGISSGIARNGIIEVTLSSIGTGTLNVATTVSFPTGEDILAISYDPATTIAYCTSARGSLYSLNFTSGVVTSYPGIWQITGTFADLVNTHLFNNKLYLSCATGTIGTLILDLVTMNPPTVFDPLIISGVANTNHFNFIVPPGKSFGYLTVNAGTTVPARGIVAKYSLTGQFISRILNTTAGSMYNVIPMLNTPASTPNGLCP